MTSILKFYLTVHVLISNLYISCTSSLHHSAITQTKKFVGSTVEGYELSGDLLKKGLTCVCTLTNDRLDFEVGLLANSSATVFVVHEADREKFLCEAKTSIQNSRAKYVDHDRIKPIAPSLSKNLVPVLYQDTQRPDKLSVQISKIDIFKSGNTKKDLKLLESLIKKNLAPELLLINTIQHSNLQKMHIKLAQLGYTRCSANGQNLIGFSHTKNNDGVLQYEGLTQHPIDHKMKLHSYQTDLFIYPVPTEQFAYQLLVDNPLRCHVNYLAFPWYIFISGYGVKHRPQLPDIHLDGGFTVCQHIHFEKILPLIKKIGLDTIFATHAAYHYFGVRVIPFPHYPINGAVPAQTKDIWYSFVGYSKTHPVRSKVLSLPADTDNVILINRDDFHFGPQVSQDEEMSEYQNILSRSRFSLCPRGTGPNTIRFWESLQAGAIPVVISDGMLLPQGIIDWDECIVRVPEHEVNTVPEILKNITQEQEEYMRENCLRAHAHFCGKNFVSIIRKTYENRPSM